MNNSKIRTFTKRFYLDQIFTRGTTDSSNHWVGSTLKAFRVIDTNNEAFQLSIVADPDRGGMIEGIPLGEVRLHNYAYIANDAVLENKVVQAGVWVEILFSVEDELVWTGNKEGSGQAVNISEGSNHFSEKIIVNIDEVTQVIPANDKRAVATLQAKTGGIFWIGNPIELSDPDFKNICNSIELAIGETFEWRNSGALNVKFDVGGTQVFSLFQEMKV